MQGFCDGTYVAKDHIDNEATDGLGSGSGTAMVPAFPVRALVHESWGGGTPPPIAETEE